MICPNCGSGKVQKRGFRNNRQRYECQEKECSVWFMGDEEVQNKNIPVLYFDIETSIRQAWLFRTGDQYITADSFKDQPFMLGYSAKWAGDSRIYSDFLTPDEAIKQDQERIVRSLWNLMSQTNITVSYNGNNFDMRHMNSFFMKYRLGLPNRIRNIDPCQIARNVLKLDSNKMDYVVKYLGLDDGKHKMEVQDWINCYYGDLKALKKMEKYCEHDVVILELITDAIKPYTSGLPNMGVYGEISEPVCPSCGSKNFKPNGFTYTSFGKYNSYRCECQTLFRSRENLLNKDKRKSIMAF